MFEFVECNSLAELSKEQKKFLELSQIVNNRVDIFGGEVYEILNTESTGKSIIRSGKSSISNDDGKKIGRWGENKTKQVLNGFSTKGINHLWDIESPNQRIECKCCKKNNGIVIREQQLINLSELEDFKNVYYSLIYYQIVNGIKVVDKMFIFPVNLIVFFYNECSNTRIYSKTGFFKRLYHGKSDKLFERDLGFRKRIFQMWGAQIKILEKPEDNIQISGIAKEII